MSNIDRSTPALAAVEPEIAERLVSRRAAIARGASVSASVAAGLRLASVPVALAALSRDAFGQGRLPAAVIGVLNYALILEELEATYYQMGLAADGLVPAQDRPIIETIRDHEVAHVQFLRDTLGASARPAPGFDFTADGTYGNVFSSYPTFLALSQAFEDTGVRAYKGQVGALIPYDAILTAALTIHSVEGRHAAEVRRLRGNFTDTEPFAQGWITGAAVDIPGAEAVYAGEDTVVQGGLDVSTVTDVATDEITEAFDEPLTQQEVLAIVLPFLA